MVMIDYLEELIKLIDNSYIDYSDMVEDIICSIDTGSRVEAEDSELHKDTIRVSIENEPWQFRITYEETENEEYKIVKVVEI